MTTLKILRTALVLITIPLITWPESEPVPKWEVRCAQAENQPAGIPDYRVSFSGDGSDVLVDNGGNPDCCGAVLIGRRFHVPSTFDELPKELRFSMEFQFWGNAKDETCEIFFFLMSAERFEQFSLDPAAQLDPLPIFKKDCWRKNDWGVLIQETIGTRNEDSENWKTWRSPDMAPHLRYMKGEDLVVVFAFQSSQPGALKKWLLRNFKGEWMNERAMWREFFRTTIDLERPDMQAVRAALASNDLDAACAAFVEHLKNRETPALPADYLPMTADEKMLKTADDFTRRYFVMYGGEPVQWGESPQWDANPPNYEQWTIGHNRHSYWLTMGRAYAQTGDEKYPKEYAAQILDFIKRQPFLIGDRGPWAIDGMTTSYGRLNMTLNSGSRMSGSWWPSYFYFRKSPCLSVMDHMWIWKGFYDHAVNMMDPRVFHPESNWGSWEAAGLYRCGVMMPEFRDSEQWIKTAEERFKLLLSTLVYPDGTPREITCMYHIGNIGFFRTALELAAVNGLNMDPALKQTVEKMCEVVMFSSRPGFGVVGFGDAYWSDTAVVKLANQIGGLFPDRQDFKYFKSRGGEGLPPEFTSWMSPWAGWYCMRTGWTPKDNYLVFDAGPIGTSHYHADKLGIVVQIGSRIVLHETGNYAYDTSPMRHYMQGTWSHNTVVVDEKIQRSFGMNDYFETASPLDNRWVSNDCFDFADGVYNLGYTAAGRPISDVTHHREVLFVKPDFWIVTDRMVPNDDAEHDYRALFHMSPGPISVDAEKKYATTLWEGGGFRIMPMIPEGLELSVVSGQTEPYYLGWMPGTATQTKQASQVAVFNWKAKGPSTRIWVLTPRTTTGEWAVGDISPLGHSEDGNIEALLSTVTGDDRFVRLPGETGLNKSRITCSRFDKSGNLYQNIIIKE